MVRSRNYPSKLLSRLVYEGARRGEYRGSTSRSRDLSGIVSYERHGTREWAQGKMLSKRVAGSEACVADAVFEGIQRVSGTVGCIQ